MNPVRSLLAGLLVLLVAAPAGAAPMLPVGADPTLDAHMERQTRLFYAFHAAPFGIGIDVSRKDEASGALIEQYLDETEGPGQTLPEDVIAVTGVHPFALVRGYSGPGGIGLRGGGASPGTAFRYLALKAEGAAPEVLAAARRDVVRAIETLHVVTAITGIPGGVARGVQRLVPEDPAAPPIPLEDLREPVPLFDEDGNPLPEVKNNGTPRADNSGGELPPGEWSWEDSCSRDQLVGWVAAMATLYDAAKGDPDIDPGLVAQLEEDARAIGAMLRQKHVFTTATGTVEEFDLVILDADGRPTLHHDINPKALEHIYFSNESSFLNHFYLTMALGIVTGLYHVSGDPEAEAFLYEDLLGARGYLEQMRPENVVADIIYAGTQTNFSNVNMAAISIFLAIYFESDPAVLAIYRDFMEQRFWAPEDTPQAARHIQQPYFHAFYLAMTDRGTDPAVVDETAALLKRWSLGPYYATPRVNCDEAELEALECLAVDGETVIEVDPAPGRGGNPIATAPLDPAIRPPSNFDARSNPFSVNGGDGPDRMLPGGDLHTAYWMLRYLEAQAAGSAVRSPNARAHRPVPGGEPPVEAEGVDAGTPAPDVVGPAPDGVGPEDGAGAPDAGAGADATADVPAPGPDAPVDSGSAGTPDTAPQDVAAEVRGGGGCDAAPAGSPATLGLLLLGAAATLLARRQRRSAP